MSVKMIHRNKYETMKNEKIILFGIYIVDSKTIKCNKLLTALHTVGFGVVVVVSGLNLYKNVYLDHKLDFFKF